MISSLVAALMRYELRATFRRVCWVGDPPGLPPDSPVVIYANHHHYYDGHLMSLLLRTLDRPGRLWMAEWDHFPFFAAVGAQPFPPDDPQRRIVTIRRTIRHLESHRQGALVYFPEGALRRPSAGIGPFPESAFSRLGRLLPSATWWPVAISVTWWGESRPTALLSGGAVTTHPPADARARLSALWSDLRTAPPRSTDVLLKGRRSPSEIWSFSFLRGFFERYL